MSDIVLNPHQIVPWDDPTSSDIVTASSALAAAVPQFLPFLTAPNVTFTPFRQENVDVAFWTRGDQTLLMAANANPSNVSLVLQGVTDGTVKEILNGGADLVAQGHNVVLTLEATGTTAWIFQQASGVKSTIMILGGGRK